MLFLESLDHTKLNERACVLMQHLIMVGTYGTSGCTVWEPSNIYLDL